LIATLQPPQVASDGSLGCPSRQLQHYSRDHGGDAKIYAGWSGFDSETMDRPGTMVGGATPYSGIRIQNEVRKGIESNRQSQIKRSGESL
jgi:hypothetical protein